MDIWSCFHGWSYQCSMFHRALCSLQYQVAHTCTSHSTCHMPCCTSSASSEDYTSACTNLHNLNPKNKNKNKKLLINLRYISDPTKTNKNPKTVNLFITKPKY